MYKLILQYFNERGVIDEVYKLALLNMRERKELLEGIKLLPGHQKRFEDMFTFLSDIYPREDARSEIASKTTYAQGKKFLDHDLPNSKKIYSQKANPIHHKVKRKKKSLMGQYESLDLETRDGINKKFLQHLEEKGGI